MNFSRSDRRYYMTLLRLPVIFVLLIVTAGAQRAQSPRAPGVDLFEQGKFSEAIVALEAAVKTPQFKSDAFAWNALGLAHYAKNDIRKSRKAFEKSVSLEPTVSIYRANLAYAYLAAREIDRAQKAAGTAIKLDPKTSGAYEVMATANIWENKLDDALKDANSFLERSPGDPQAYILKANILVGLMGRRVVGKTTVRDELHFLNEAVEVLEKGMVKAKSHPRLSDLTREHESLSVFYKHFSRDPTAPTPVGPLPPEPGVTPLVVTYTPKASYTDQARQNGVEGAIRVVILLGASGQVEHMMLVSRLGFGLDEQVMRAVRAIKFEPKKRDGKPVSVVIIREYTFSIY